MYCVSSLLFSFEIPIHLQDQFNIGPTLIADRIHCQKHNQSPFNILPLVKDACNLKPEFLVAITSLRARIKNNYATRYFKIGICGPLCYLKPKADD